MLMSMMSAPASATIAAAERITSGSCPKSWTETGMLVGMEPEQLAQGALVAVVEAEARDHLRDGQSRPVAARLQADEPVADPGQGRQQHAIGDLDVADAKGAVSGGCMA